MKTVLPSSLLKLALAADAVVSGAVAVLQVLAANWLAELLQLPRSLLLETGVFLLAYTVLLIVLARSPRVWSVLIGLIVIGNAGWAACCLVLLVTGMLSPNLLGVAFVLVQAFAVLIFAVLEFRGLSASVPSRDGSAARA